jgi:hypothetical protein
MKGSVQFAVKPTDNGFYWYLSDLPKIEHGPFDTEELAREDADIFISNVIDDITSNSESL